MFLMFHFPRTGTLILQPGSCIDTIIETAYTQVLIPQRTIGISFEPANSIDNWNGQLTFGGIDESKFTGPLNWV